MIYDKNDTALVNQCNYTDTDSLKFILKNYHQFIKLKHKGNTTAVAILVDIDCAINKLKKRQKYCLKKHYLEGYLLYEIADELDIKKQTVQEHIKKAIKNISNHLEGGSE